MAEDVLSQLQRTLAGSSGGGAAADYPAAPEFTPEELNLYWHHLGNLYRPDRYMSPGGDISTVLQSVVNGPGGKYYSIPTVWDAQPLTVQEGRDKAAQAGWQSWPAYSTPDEADARYQLLHRYMDQAAPQFRAVHGVRGLLDR